MKIERRVLPRLNVVHSALQSLARTMATRRAEALTGNQTPCAIYPIHYVIFCLQQKFDQLADRGHIASQPEGRILRTRWDTHFILYAWEEIVAMDPIIVCHRYQTA